MYDLRITIWDLIRKSKFIMNQTNTIMAEDQLGIYAYCFTNIPVTMPVSLTGIDGKHKIFVIEKNGLYATVSNVLLEEFNAIALENNMKDIRWLASRAARHEEIIEYAMTHAQKNTGEFSLSPLLKYSCSKKEHTADIKENNKKNAREGRHTAVVPLRFCTIYKNQDGLFKAIEPYHKEIMKFLDYTSDKTEWSVKIFCNRDEFIDSQNKDEDVNATVYNQMSLLPGEAYMLKKKMHKHKKEVFKADIQKIVRDISIALSKGAACHQFLPCIDKNIHGKSSDMVLNMAFLVNFPIYDLFRDMVNMFAEKYRDKGIEFRMTGPWPPYVFCPNWTNTEVSR